MRDIRFRAWDRHNKVWTIKVDGSVEDKANPWMGNRNPQYIVSQYTGLKDKNGVEIYEGDIVEVKVIGKEYQRAEVKWREENIGFWHSVLAYKPKDIEVIGNIYSNPELLAPKESK